MRSGRMGFASEPRVGSCSSRHSAINWRTRCGHPPAAVRAGDGRLAKLLKENKSDPQLAEELFLATLGRLPRPHESAALAKALAEGPKDEVFRDLFWALVNSKEFSFNH